MHGQLLVSKCATWPKRVIAARGLRLKNEFVPRGHLLDAPLVAQPTLEVASLLCFCAAHKSEEHLFRHLYKEHTSAEVRQVFLAGSIPMNTNILNAKWGWPRVHQKPKVCRSFYNFRIWRLISVNLVWFYLLLTHIRLGISLRFFWTLHNFVISGCMSFLANRSVHLHQSSTVFKKQRNETHKQTCSRHCCSFKHDALARQRRTFHPHIIYASNWCDTYQCTLGKNTQSEIKQVHWWKLMEESISS